MIADRLVDWLRHSGKSQGEVAEEAGVAESSVSRLLNARIDSPRRATIYKLARALGASSVEEFLDGPKAESPSFPEAALRDGLGHAYIARPLADLVDEARGMTIPEIMTRLQDLGEENRFLKSIKKRDYPEEARNTPEALRTAGRRITEEIKDARRSFVPKVMTLAEIGREARRRSDLPEDEKQRSIELLQEEAERILAEANEPSLF